MWNTYINVGSIRDAIDALKRDPAATKIIAGGTDLMLEFKRGQRKSVNNVIDISRIPGLDQITLDVENVIHIGPNVTHNDCISSKLLREFATPLALASLSVGSPQIRNRGTIAGNLITASPANDTIPPLLALNAELTLISSSGQRKVKLKDFYTGVRRSILRNDEIVTDISFKALERSQKGIFIKMALREAQAISVVNTAIILTMNDNIIENAAITLGSVAPTVIECPKASAYLIRKPLDMTVIEKASEIVMQEAHPISDIRGSAGYRTEMVKVVAKRGLTQLLEETIDDRLTDNPVCLVNFAYTSKPIHTCEFGGNDLINSEVNGKQVSFESKPTSLLNEIRDNLGLAGTKEGCGEGECGACTLFLDGKAVMGCLVPAPRADSATVVTIEGITPENGLNVIQQAFVDEGAVQCGYCTPGFIMSATMLLEEKARPTREDIKFAISGNLCRCTGYYKIIKAIETATEKTGG
jgi:carbon-monoxide dehydrogenase medium subunit